MLPSHLHDALACRLFQTIYLFISKRDLPSFQEYFIYVEQIVQQRLGKFRVRSSRGKTPHLQNLASMKTSRMLLGTKVTLYLYLTKYVAVRN